MKYAYSHTRLFIKQTKALSKLLYLVLLWVFGSAAFALQVFAGQAVVLSDTELDCVYAEGLFFDFEISFGAINDLMSANSPGNPPSKKDITHSINQNIKFIKSGLSTSNSGNNAGQNTEANMVTANAPAGQNNTAALISELSVSGLNSQQAESAASSNGGQAPNTGVQFVPALTNNQHGQLQLLTFNTGPELTQNDIVDIPVAPAPPSQPDMPQLPAGGFTEISTAAYVGSNVVIVDDFAQQYLSALVNVNAAGSVVPVLINITININSNVENLSNLNSIDLRNYYRFNIR